MSKFLFEVQQKNRLQQKGLLKRFSITCYGHQESREEMRAEKSEKFKELKDKRNSKEFEEWFLTYRPIDKMKTKTGTGTKAVTKVTATKSKSLKKATKAKKKSQKRGRGGFFIFK